MAQILEDFFEAQNIFLAEAEAEALLSEPQKLPARPSRSDGNVFSITYAFEKRDKKTAWSILQKLFEAGIPPENLIGILFWKVKTMLADKKFSKWSEAELKNISAKIIAIYHDGHRGMLDAPIELEKLILETL